MDRSRPPAWYPDPRDPGRLRRWDGRTWTGDVRPFPSWLRTLQLAPGPARATAASRTIRRLWVSSAACLVLALVLLDVLGHRPGSLTSMGSVARVADRQFVAAADAACRKSETVHASVGASSPASVDRAVEAQDRLVDALRAIPVAPRDQAAVDRWLSSWDAWTLAGHRYAQATADHDDGRAHEISQRSKRAKAEIDAFAAANGMPHCVQFQRR